MKYKLLFIIFVVFGLIFHGIGYWQDQKNGILTVSFLDVGQGDAIFIQTPGGYDMLIDGGASSLVLHELGTIMPFWDYTIDAVVMTHPHTDHAGGLVDVMEKYEVVQAYLSVNNYYNDVFDEWEAVIQENDITVDFIDSYRSFVLDDGVVVEFLMPSDYPENSESKKYSENINNASIVVKLTYQDSTYLFTGDAEEEVEQDLVAEYDVDVDVLKVGHHGSKTSSTYGFLEEVTPEYAIISVGKDNRFGHPHRQVLDRLRNFNAEILRTDQVGTVQIQTDGHEIWPKTSLPLLSFVLKFLES